MLTRFFDPRASAWGFDQKDLTKNIHPPHVNHHVQHILYQKVIPQRYPCRFFENIPIPYKSNRNCYHFKFNRLFSKISWNLIVPPKSWCIYCLILQVIFNRKKLIPHRDKSIIQPLSVLSSTEH